MTKHNAIVDAINAKSYAIVLGSEYRPQTDHSFFTISVNNVVHDMEVYYYTNGMYSYYIDNGGPYHTYNVNDLTSWF